MKRFLVVGFLLLSTFGFAQILVGTVINPEGETLANTKVFDSISGNNTRTDAFGFFSLSIESKAYVSFVHPEYQTVFYRSDSIPQWSGDSIFVTVEMYTKAQQLDPVFVNSEKIQEVFSEKSVNVVDYLPLETGVLLLLDQKSGRSLRFSKNDGSFWEKQLNDLRIEGIEIDCFDNVHMLSKDSAYQVWLEQAVYIVNVISQKEYQRHVRPCIADYDTQAVFQNFSHHNKKYTLTAINNETREKTFLFYVFDTVGLRVARSYYYSIIGSYMANTPDWKNVIKLGVWTGSLMEIAGSNQYNWFTKFGARALDIHTFCTDSLIYTFDQFSDSIHVYNLQHERVKSRGYPFEKSTTVFDVAFDRFKKRFYEVTRDSGVYSYREIDVFNSSKVQVIELSEAPFARNRKLYNNWLYFLVLENDYYRVYRKEIPSFN